MKLVNATVINNFKFKEGSEIVEHPSEGIQCVKIGDKYYSPTIVWMEYHPEGDPENGAASEEEDGVWIELDADEEGEIISETYSEEIDLREASEDELEDMYGEE